MANPLSAAEGGLAVFRTVVDGLLDLLWPPRTTCIFCTGPLGEDGIGGLFCADCWASMGFPAGRRYCFNCTRPHTGWGDYCADCARGSVFGYVYALGLHEGALREAVHQVKYGGREALGILLGTRLGALVSSRPDCIVPMPLHPFRLRQRGYNQAALIAQGLAEVLGVPVVDRVLRRRRWTARQANLDRLSRQRNMENAFDLPMGAPCWQGRSVLLVDDVLTTGSTARAAARVLWESGAADVNLAVLAVSATPVAQF